MESVSRVVVITGAASGIGLALVEICLQRSMNVALVDSNEEKLSTVIEHLSTKYSSKIIGFASDVSKLQSMQRVARDIWHQFKRIDWLINNAGIFSELAPIWELDNNHIQSVMDVNLFGVINGIKSFLPYLFEQSHCSSILNMSSFYGLCSGSHVAPYSISKHAVIALSESLHFDLQRTAERVSVSVACPSLVKTELLSNSDAKGSSLQHLFSTIMAQARPAMDVAESIINQFDKGIFYILPDREVKNYCQNYMQAIVDQGSPYQHGIEKLINSLIKRASLVKNSIEV